MTTLRALACLIVSGLLLQGCDSATDPPHLPRSFQATVSGDLTRQFDGEATFDPDYGVDRVPALNLRLFGASGLITFTSLSITATPELGSYDMGSLGSAADVLAILALCGGAEGCGPGQTYLSTGGTLTFTETSKDRLEGIFDFTATNGADSVHVVGDFDAAGENYDAGLR
ncbi:MAG TPA: hypothetical protein VFG50_03260 [Rhodothermales bacterium]|nr:hypothetical protein [Rhodothermales bacterium]